MLIKQVSAFESAKDASVRSSRTNFGTTTRELIKKKTTSNIFKVQDSINAADLPSKIPKTKNST